MPSHCEKLTREIEELKRALAEIDADIAEKSKQAAEEFEERQKQLLYSGGTKSGGVVGPDDGPPSEDGTNRHVEVPSTKYGRHSCPPSDDEDNSDGGSEAPSDCNNEYANPPTVSNRILSPPIPHLQSGAWSATSRAQETTLPPQLSENLPRHAWLRTDISHPNKMVHTTDTPPVPCRHPDGNDALANTDPTSPAPGRHNTATRSASVFSSGGAGSASPHSASSKADLDFPPLGTLPGGASKAARTGGTPGPGPACPNVQGGSKIDAGSVLTREETHFVNSVGIEVTTAKYSPPEGHSVPWARDACRPVKIVQPPSGYILRAMVPISYRDSALSARERAEAFNKRLQDLEKATGLSGRYPRGEGLYSGREHDPRRPSDRGRYHRRAERGYIRHSGDPAQGRGGRRGSGADTPTPAARDSSSSPARSADSSAEDKSATQTFIRPPTPLPDLVSVRRTVVIENVPDGVSLPYILRALGNTGCIEEIKMEENYQGHYATVEFAEEETASMFAARRSLLVRISRERSETLPIVYSPAIEVPRAKAAPFAKGLSRIVVIGPCPEEYYVNAYLELMGEEAQMQSGLVEYIWVMVENMSDAWNKHTLDISLETRGKLIQATISFSSIKAALEVAEAARDLDSFRGVKVTFGQDPYVGPPLSSLWS